ncbi:MAG: PIN domain-containing protein [Fimbriimonadales bacterium]|nr:PIN domain-containing protein [Fimbriimonadales bacterium]
MKPVVIDTDIMLDILRGRNEQVRYQAQQYTLHYPRYSITQITLTELAHGFYKREGSLTTLNKILAQCEILTLTDSAAMLAGEMLARLESSGLTIGFADTIIAAVAVDQGRTLVSANEKHFRRIADLGYPLIVENWRLGSI